MLYQTKVYTGKNTSQDCKRRSVVYETRCITCEEREVKEIEEKFDKPEDEDKKKEALRMIRIHKYIGETGKSAYERGSQHLAPL